ncbi:6-bladed beta-propeller [Rhodohalobacter sp. SW132]|uniref:6-bladed beta-propeller n=1 Tax=Rhodohalobacter sp. SW132 TaxID=2293433 RepID=UPI000E24F98C|nr:6-bladed beta-propeller [Rhodohalobacter sp. SW132]REL37782.1 6-bladed beta-propeller [Rhodohalobacter sp. SW132]
MHKFIFLLLPIVFYGCSQQETEPLPDYLQELENLTVYSADRKPNEIISFQKDVEYGDTGEVLIGRMGEVAVNENGRVYIADSDQLKIKVYAPDGQFLTRLGRRGEGPGEFIELSGIQTSQNRLFTFDRNQQRAVVFDTETLSYNQMISLAGNRNEIQELRGSYLNKFYPRNDGSFLMLFLASNTAEGVNDWDKIETRTLSYLLDESGNVDSEKLFERTSSYQVILPLGGRSVGMPVKFYGALLTDQSDDDHIYLAWSEDFLIKKYSPAGEYMDAFYYNVPRVSLDPENAFPEAGPELIREAARSAEIPETAPVLDEMHIDDENRLWISTIVEDFDVYEWWVLEETGELITTFEWPRDEPIEVVRNGMMYTRETDEETGLQQVVRYQIEMEEM